MDSEQKHPAPPRDAVFAYYPVGLQPRGDEIRLVDLWLVLVRRKVVFFIVAGLVLAAGLAYALLTPPKYRYSALIELGLVPTASGPKSAESVSTALAKINEAFLPAVLAEYLKTQTEGTSPPKIRASIPKGSETLMLTAEGPVEEGFTLMELQSAVIARLAEDHAGFIDADRRSLQANITASKNQLQTLTTNGAALDNQAKRTEEFATTLRERRGKLQQDLGVAMTLEQRLLSANEASRDTAALLQANVESRALQNQLMALDERLAVDLPKQADDLRAAIEGNQREILAQQERIADLEARLASIRETRATQPPTRSLEKTGPRKTTVVFLSVFLAMLGAALTAFAVESISNFWAKPNEGKMSPADN